MRLLIILNILAFLAVLAVNYLANALPLNGNTTGELSGQYPNLFVPAGITFAIWGVIYTWLLLWIGAQAGALFSKDLQKKIGPSVEKVQYWFVLSCLLNIAWIFAWHWEMLPLSVAIMIALMTALVILNKKAGTGMIAASGLEKWLAHAPFGIYQGWITIALIANVTTLLVSLGWQGGGWAEANWSLLLILIGVMLATTIIRNTNNIFHGFAVMWALYGVYLARSGDTYTGGSVPVEIGALAGIALILLWVAIRLQRWLAY